MRNHGARLKFSGVAGPLTDSPGSSIKRRNLDFQLSGPAMSDILDAFIDRGEQAGLLALGDAMAAEYMGSSEYGWAWRDDAKTLSFLRHNSD